MSLIYGIGFPPFRGGACRYVDQMGVANFVALADKYVSLGKLYDAPRLLRDMAASGKKFFADLGHEFGRVEHESQSSRCRHHRWRAHTHGPLEGRHVP